MNRETITRQKSCVGEPFYDRNFSNSVDLVPDGVRLVLFTL
jgi:hypothetical protein